MQRDDDTEDQDELDRSAEEQQQEFDDEEDEIALERIEEEEAQEHGGEDEREGGDKEDGEHDD